MAIRAVVFDIGGVLKITPGLGMHETWEKKLNLEPGGLNRRLGRVWRGGSTGTMSLEQVHADIAQILQMDAKQAHEFMDDFWREYLGTLNVELVEYFRALRPRFKTAIISNSFVGAREREHEHYGIGDLCDFILYSHEVGFSKPDARIFALACERLELNPSEIIFVDDRAEVMTSAQEMGMHCIEFKENAQAIAAIDSCVERNL